MNRRGLQSVWTPLLSLCAALACASAGTPFDPRVVASLTPGMTVAQVDAKLGAPNGESFTADGQRIQTWLYSHANGITGRGEGRSVAILFDADGKMVRVVSTSATQMHTD